MVFAPRPTPETTSYGTTFDLDVSYQEEKETTPDLGFYTSDLGAASPEEQTPQDSSSVLVDSQELPVDAPTSVCACLANLTTEDSKDSEDSEDSLDEVSLPDDINIITLWVRDAHIIHDVVISILDTVLDLKTFLHGRTSYPVEDIMLYTGFTPLRNDYTIAYYNLGDNDIVTLTVPIRGGARHLDQLIDDLLAPLPLEESDETLSIYTTSIENDFDESLPSLLVPLPRSFTIINGELVLSAAQDSLGSSSPDSFTRFISCPPGELFPDISIFGDDVISVSDEGDTSAGTDGTPPIAVRMPGQTNRNSQTPWRRAQVQNRHNTARVHPSDVSQLCMRSQSPVLMFQPVSYTHLTLPTILRV